MRKECEVVYLIQLLVRNDNVHKLAMIIIYDSA